MSCKPHPIKRRASLRMEDGGELFMNDGSIPKVINPAGRSYNAMYGATPAAPVAPPKAGFFDPIGRGLRAMMAPAPVAPVAPAPVAPVAPAPVAPVAPAPQVEVLQRGNSPTVGVAPLVPKSNGLSFNTNVAMKTLGLNEGRGRTTLPRDDGNGGKVVGPAGKDKTPSMYSNGEIVVSNKVQEDNPGLGQMLDQLRTRTLIGEGKDPVEVDRNQLRQAGMLKADTGKPANNLWGSVKGAAGSAWGSANQGAQNVMDKAGAAKGAVGNALGEAFGGPGTAGGITGTATAPKPFQAPLVEPHVVNTEGFSAPKTNAYASNVPKSPMSALINPNINGAALGSAVIPAMEGLYKGQAVANSGAGSAASLTQGVDGALRTGGAVLGGVVGGGIGTGIGAVFPPAAPWSVPLGIAGGAYLGDMAGGGLAGVTRGVANYLLDSSPDKTIMGADASAPYERMPAKQSPLAMPETPAWGSKPAAAAPAVQPKIDMGAFDKSMELPKDRQWEAAAAASGTMVGGLPAGRGVRSTDLPPPAQGLRQPEMQGPAPGGTTVSYAPDGTRRVSVIGDQSGQPSGSGYPSQGGQGPSLRGQGSSPSGDVMQLPRTGDATHDRWVDNQNAMLARRNQPWVGGDSMMDVMRNLSNQGYGTARSGQAMQYLSHNDATRTNAEGNIVQEKLRGNVQMRNKDLDHEAAMFPFKNAQMTRSALGKFLEANNGDTSAAASAAMGAGLDPKALYDMQRAHADHRKAGQDYGVKANDEIDKMFENAFDTPGEPGKPGVQDKRMEGMAAEYFRQKTKGLSLSPEQLASVQGDARSYARLVQNAERNQNKSLGGRIIPDAPHNGIASDLRGATYEQNSFLDGLIPGNGRPMGGSQLRTAGGQAYNFDSTNRDGAFIMGQVDQANEIAQEEVAKARKQGK